MIGHFEIVRQHDELNREVWRFGVSDGMRGHADNICVYVDFYVRQTKESRRKKLWTDEAYYNCLTTRNNTQDKPPLPADVADEARKRVEKLIVVTVL